MLKRIFIILIILCLGASCSTLNGEKNALSLSHLSGHLVELCRIYDLEGKLLEVIINGGGVCYLEDNGSVLFSDNSGSLSYFDKNLNLQWKKAIFAHHQMNMAGNGDFLVLDSENRMHDSKKMRVDIIRRVSKSGEILGSFDFQKRMQELKKKREEDYDRPGTYYEYARSVLKYRDEVRLLTSIGRKTFDNAEIEYTHANSIYEIPENQSPEKELKPGNIIVNVAHFGMIIILSPDLSEIIKTIPAPSFFVHDVFVNYDGTLFIYNNFSNIRGHFEKGEKFYSAIEIYEYPSMEIKRIYGQKPEERFFANRLGGGEILADGSLLFSNVENNMASINVIKAKNGQKHTVTLGSVNNLSNFQQIKFRDLTEFLKNNQFSEIMGVRK